MNSLRRRFLIVLSAVASMALFVGCGASSTPTIGVESPMVTPERQREPFDSPQSTPTPVPSTRPASALPTPSASDLATVRGVFVRDLTDGANEPGAETNLRLARIIRAEDGTPLVAAAGEKSSPTATTQEDGTFIFADVPPDTYALVVVTPLGSYMIEDATGEDFLFSVEPGEMRDLGEIHTDVPY